MNLPFKINLTYLMMNFLKLTLIKKILKFNLVNILWNQVSVE